MGKYYIGLDVGTDSVGWATSNENFELLRIKGKTAWGSRIFEAANDAKDRRLKRANKRRLNRRKYRIILLNSLFEDLITPIDNTFFRRLLSSSYALEDRDVEIPFLFASKEEEKSFHKKFPTIWHLRKALVNGDEDALKDIRNVYIAIHHIIKYRGNFLKTGEFKVNNFNFSLFDEFNGQIKSFCASLQDISEEEVEFDLIPEQNYGKIIKLVEDDTYNKRQKPKAIKELFNSCVVELNPYIELFTSLLSGASFDLSKLDKDRFEKEKIVFDSSYDDKEDEFKQKLGDLFFIVDTAKKIYDFVELKKLLKNYQFISESFSQIYDTHKEELSALKKICRDIDEKFNLNGVDSLYYKIFKDPDNEKNYASFVGVSSGHSRNKDIHSFNSFILELLSSYDEYLKNNRNYQSLRCLLERDECLLINANKSTSLIPHQLHKNELARILDNAEKYHKGIGAIKEKLIQLFMFRVPYYYGPLNDSSPYSSIVRNSNKIVTPWNISEVIDDRQTKINFINKLTNYCQYLIGEGDILPRQSLIYQRYIILDRLNSLSINGARISKAVRDDLLNNLILRNSSVSVSRISAYLKKQYEIYKKDGVSISGINQKDAFINSSYFFFTNFFGIEVLSEEQFKIAEQIIKFMTIYKDNVKDGVDYINESVCLLTSQQKKLLETQRFDGWSPFSKKLLTGVKSVDDSGVVLSIIDVMGEEVLNFQECLYSSKYSFKEKIDAINQEISGVMSDEEFVEELINSTPPKMRRSVIQAKRIVEEIVKFKHEEPKYISIEVTRENDPKKKGKETASRIEEISKFIKSFEKDNNNIIKSQGKKLSQDLNSLIEAKNLTKLKGKHLYLYFKQDGIDLYTGKPMDLYEVLNGTAYDVDHIIPQRLIKDDSLDNLVLVNRVDNQNTKNGRYPLPEVIRNNENVRLLWKILLSKGAISNKKYNNLIRSNPLTDDELSMFVNAQINVVNQSNIVIRNILQRLYPNTILIFSKAQYPSEIRKQLVIPKMRDLNDTHHAIDAYLNIVSGVLLYERFNTKFWYNDKIKDNKYESLNLSKYLMSALGKANLGDKVYKTCSRRDILLSYRNEYQDSKFYKETIYKAKTSDSLIPVHTKGFMKDIDKYGGYKELATNYFIIATISGKKTRKELMTVPLLYEKLFSKNKLRDKLISEFNLKKGESIDVNFKKKIFYNTELIVNGANYLLVGKGDRINLKPISPVYLPFDYQVYLNKGLKNFELFKDRSEDKIEIILNRQESGSFVLSKEKNLEILDFIINLANNKKYDFCPMVTQIRDWKHDEFKALKIGEQIKEIMSLLALFTRKSRSLSLVKKSSFLKSKTFINECQVYIVYRSITGLETFKKLL